MRILNKALLFVGAITLSVSCLNAQTYIVKKGDTLGQIVHELGFESIDAAGINSVPSGNINLIFVGDEIQYIGHKKKKRFVLRKPKLDLNKFCFEDNRSIHYRANERCKPGNSHKKKLVRQHKHSNH
jgi:hypothetical protein